MLITCNEKAFAARAEIKEMADKTSIEAYLGNFACTQDHGARKPIVAAVRGFALGGGCELAMQCDVVIAADNFKFGQPEIKSASFSASAARSSSHARSARPKAMELILTGA